MEEYLKIDTKKFDPLNIGDMSMFVKKYIGDMLFVRIIQVELDDINITYLLGIYKEKKVDHTVNIILEEYNDIKMVWNMIEENKIKIIKNESFKTGYEIKE